MSWKSMTFQGPPTLIVGLREGRRQVEGRRVSLETRVHKDLNEVVKRTLARLDDMTPITYTPYIGTGEGEYLTIKPKALVTQSVSKDDDGVLTQKEQTAALVELVQRADDLPDIGAGELIQQLKDGSLYLQAICRRTSTGRVGFVTKSAARQILKAGSIPLIKGKSDHFTKTEPPEIVLEPDVHVVRQARRNRGPEQVPVRVHGVGQPACGQLRSSVRQAHRPRVQEAQDHAVALHGCRP
jgi:hypothetical protein